MNSQNFNGKVALVTGGASGIGKTCALKFACGGAKVAIADLNAELGRDAVISIEQAGGSAIFLQVDVTDPTAVEKMVADTVTAFGHLDIAVNNAGIVSSERSPTGSYNLEAWHKVINVNLNGVFYCMRYEIPQMLNQGSGTIVNMASILGSVGLANNPAYVSSKHAVVGLTKSAALEYGQQGIRINSVGPGFIKTPLLTNVIDEPMAAYLSGLHAMGRLGEPEEVANLVAFLCSDEASFLTGGYYLVDGGYTSQ